MMSHLQKVVPALVGLAFVAGWARPVLSQTASERGQSRSAPSEDRGRDSIRFLERPRGTPASTSRGEGRRGLAQFDQLRPIVPESPGALPAYNEGNLPPYGDGNTTPWNAWLPPGTGPGCAPREFWEHRSGLFGEYLFLQPRNVDPAYAVPQNGAVPIGGVGVVSPDYSSGFRVGGFLALDSSSSLSAGYTWFGNEESSSISVTAPDAVRALLLHPGTAGATTSFLQANANYDIDFQFVDFAYRGLISGSTSHSLNYLIGLRYGTLEQGSGVQYANSTTTVSLAAGIDFDGLGPQFGLEGERRIGLTSFTLYGHWSAALLAGSFDASYVQTTSLSATPEAVLSWSDDRIVPVLEYEFGLAWTSPGGNLRLSGGYYVSSWWNILSTGAFVDAVQANNFVAVDDTLTFDGLAVRLELRR